MKMYVILRLIISHSELTPPNTTALPSINTSALADPADVVLPHNLFVVITKNSEIAI